MQSNNPILGDDRLPDEDEPITEQPTANSQDEPEVMATDDQPVFEDAESVVPPLAEQERAEDRADLDPSAEEDGEGVAALDDSVTEPPEPEDTGEAFAATDDTPDTGETPDADDTPDTDDTPGADDTPDADDTFEAEDDEGHDEFDTDDEEDDQDEEEVEVPGEEAPAFRKGQIVDGTVLDTSPTEVLVDLGEGHIGVVASRELERMDRSALEGLAIGAPVTAFVLKARGSDGRPVLSLARAEEEKNWRLAEEHHQNQEVYFGKVAGYNKGGLIVRFGKVRGFVPASQVSRERQRRAVGESPEERWGGMVGDDIAVKVVEIDRARNRLILSERAAQREARDQQKARLLKDLTVGEVRKGRVISVADFGAFVDLGGADGLVHLTEISWKHVTHPREVLEVGQEVEVEVISVDPDRRRIGLSMKRREHDPWDDVVAAYEVGQLVQATVTKLTKFGAFARLVDAPEIEGLIHISELADYRVSHPREVVLVGDVLTLRIVKIDADQRRLGLSLRQVDSPKYMDQDWMAYAEDIETEMSTAETETDPAETVAAVEEAPVEEAPVEEAPVDEEPITEDAVAEVTDSPAVEEAPSEAPAEDEAPEDEAPLEETPEIEAPEEEAPDEDGSDEDTPEE